MKKLIIAAAIVCAAAFAKASSANWGIYEAYAPGSTDYSSAFGYAVYFFDAATYDRADALNALANGKTDFISNALDNGQIDSWGSVGGEARGLSYVGGESMTAYLVVFNNSNAAKADLAFVSETLTDKLPTNGATSMNFNFPDVETTYDAMQNKDNWQSVPEPTSGLMLLIGMGALALRRRRA